MPEEWKFSVSQEHCVNINLNEKETWNGHESDKLTSFASQFLKMRPILTHLKYTTLCGLSPRENYTNRATAASWRS
jgi:hypothetical protein